MVNASLKYRPANAACWVTALCILLCVALSAADESSESGGAGEYRFVGGETISLSQPFLEHTSTRQIVTNTGAISVPTGGIVKILGKTLAEAQKIVREKMEEESGERRVRVSVTLESVPVKKAYFSGEVKATQALDLPIGKPLSLLQALTLVGGVTDFADLSRVNIIRTARNGQRTSLEVDASRLGLPGNTDLGPALQADDIIMVPRGDVFVLAGEFARTGPVSRKELLLNRGEPARLSRVLFITGGLKPSANRRTMRVIRTASTGEKQVIPVDVDAVTGLSSGGRHNKHKREGDDEAGDLLPPPRGESIKADDDDPETGENKKAEAVEAGRSTGNDPDIVLQDGDVLTVAGSGGVIILGKVKSPGLYALPAPTLKLSRLVAMAGGFSEFAKGSSVTVIRAGPPKKVITVDVNAIVKDGHLEKDVDLEDGDYVFVGERVL